ncbi:MAG TPA: hypothetical protein EYO82_10655 [Gammaproteobacteria bacterium]|nr:hypothetical protein [Gammaproteobacteria bacterium]
MWRGLGGLRDFITGVYLLTKDDITLTKQEFSNIFFDK